MVVVNDFSPAELGQGNWLAVVQGREESSRFVATTVTVSARPDPLEGEDANLPRVLVIGDSISMNYHEAAKSALAGVANYRRCEGNSFSSNYGMQYVDFWLGDYQKAGYQWDVIQFNHGLHDLKQTGPDAPYAVPIEDYKTNLRRVIRQLQKTGASLIFCTTTPVQNSTGGRYGRQKGAEMVFNKAALEVIAEYPEIQVTDLAKVVNESSVFDKWRTGRDVHYYKAHEQEVLGAAIAGGIKKALASR